MIAIEFDAAKDRRNIRKHGISLARFVDMDEASWAIGRDLEHSEDEDRWSIVGFIDDRLYRATVTFRVEIYRVISLRPATRREQRLYAEAKPTR